MVELHLNILLAVGAPLIFSIPLILYGARFSAWLAIKITRPRENAVDLAKDQTIRRC